MLNFKKTLSAAIILSSLLLTSCEEDYYSSPFINEDQFVIGLTVMDETAYDSYVELYADETYRSSLEGQEEWFVIWDEKFQEHKAVSLQYIRSIEYWSYASNRYSLASEFRAIENEDIAWGDSFGDYWGDDYEVVEYDEYDGYFYGVNSGHAYEDEGETTDVNLLAAKKEQNSFFKQASMVSMEFNVKIDTAMSLVTLGSKMKSMKSSGELSNDDYKVLSKDIVKLTGVSVEEVLEAKISESAKEKVLETASKNLGTSAANIEQKLLPELFGINL